MKTRSLAAAVVALFAFGFYDAQAQTRDGNGTKFCSIVVGGNWRDTISVPQAWTVDDCEEFRVAMGASEAQIGCLFGRGRSAFSMAGEGYVPRPNCGWEEPRRRERSERVRPRDAVTDWEIIIERTRRR